MTIVGIAAASVGAVVCFVYAAFCVYLMVTPNYSVNVRPKVVGGTMAAICLALGVGMVLVVFRKPAGTYFNIVGLGTLVLVGVMLKYGRR